MEPTNPAAPTYRDGTLVGGSAAFIQLLILAAGGISAYLLSISLTGGTAIGCGPTSSCEEVLHSNWAYVLGIPVSAFALIVDVTLLITTFFCDAKSTPQRRRAAWKILIPGALLLLGAAAWFIAVQALILHHFCPWCMTAHTCGALAAIMLLKRAPVGGVMAENVPALPRGIIMVSAVVALLTITAMGVTQKLVPRKTFSVANIKSETSAHSTNIATTDLQSNKPPAPIRTPFPVLGGLVVLDLDTVPIWGSSTAPIKLVSLYDYTCPHCRAMHPRLAALQQIVGDKLAIVSLPMPSDCECNRFFKNEPSRTNACVYARLGLTVWRAKHEMIQEFDDWVYSFNQTPSLTAVTNKVIELIGQTAFETASRDPWIEQQLQTDIELYGISLKDYHTTVMPQFMIGTEIITGLLSIDDLQALVAKYDFTATATGK